MGTRRVKVEYQPTEFAQRAPSRIEKDRREFWRTEFPWCWFCEDAPSTECHEIARGTGNRSKAKKERFTWASSCNDCNFHQVTDYSIWPLERQLAVKWINDREYFNLIGFNRLRGLADSAIEMHQVIFHICRLLDGKGGRF